MNDMAQQHNRQKLRAIMSLFGINVTQVSKIGGVSRTYASRYLSGHLKPSAEFLRNLELGLGRLIEQRSGQVFSIQPTQLPTDNLNEAGIRV